MINLLSHVKDRKKFETNNKSVALSVLFVPHKKKVIRQACISKHNVVLLMITSGEKWHYLGVKSISGLLQRITSNHNGDMSLSLFICNGELT